MISLLSEISADFVLSARAVLRGKPPSLTNAYAICGARTTFLLRSAGIDLAKESKTLFPRHENARVPFEVLKALGYSGITSGISRLIREKGVLKRSVQEFLYAAYTFYALPYIQGGGETLLLSEDANRLFNRLGMTTKPSVDIEIREDLLGWLGFKLPRKIDRKYVSKYLEICEDLSPSLHKVVIRIENKAKGFENAKEELKLIICNLESELALISERRDTMAGAVKWLTAFPISVAQDLLGMRARTDLEKGK